MESMKARLATEGLLTRMVISTAADALLSNDGSLAELYTAVDALWHDRLLPYERNVRERRVARPGQVQLAEYDPTWPQQYARLAARIRHALGPADLRIDHIGPTAGSPGCRATGGTTPARPAAAGGRNGCTAARTRAVR